MRSVIFKPAHEQRMLCSPVLSLCRELAMLIGRCFRPIKQAKARSPILEGPENFSHPDELKMVLRARNVSGSFEKTDPRALVHVLFQEISPHHDFGLPIKRSNDLG